MSRRDPSRAKRPGQPRQKLVARFPSGDLLAYPLLSSQTRHIRVFHAAWQPKLLALRAHELGVVVRGCAAHPVMKMAGVKAQFRIVLVPEFAQDVQQRQRIRPAGNRDNDAVAVGEHPVPPHRHRNLLEQDSPRRHHPLLFPCVIIPEWGVFPIQDEQELNASGDVLGASGVLR